MSGVTHCEAKMITQRAQWAIVLLALVVTVVIVWMGWTFHKRMVTLEKNSEVPKQVLETVQRIEAALLDDTGELK